MDQNPPFLNRSDIETIFSGIVSVPEKYSELREHLLNHGIRSWLVREAFDDSFSGGFEARVKFEIERSKSAIGSIRSLFGNPWGHIFIYHSEFIQELKNNRDRENAAPASALKEKYGSDCFWRQEIAAHLREQKRLACRSPDVWASLMSDLEFRAKKAFLKECSSLKSDYPESDDLYSQNRNKFIKNTSNHHFGNFGFLYDAKRSTGHEFVLSKIINDDWGFALVMSPRKFLVGDVGGGMFYLKLHLIKNSWQGYSNKAKPTWRAGDAFWIEHRFSDNFAKQYALYESATELSYIMWVHSIFWQRVCEWVESYLVFPNNAKEV